MATKQVIEIDVTYNGWNSLKIRDVNEKFIQLCKEAGLDYDRLNIREVKRKRK